MGDSQILEYNLDNYFESDSRFGIEQGLAFAVAVTKNGQPLPPSIGTIAIYSDSYNDSTGEKRVDLLPSHICSDQERGLKKGAPGFMPLSSE